MGVKVLLEERITGIESIDELISKRDWTSAYVEASKKRQDKVNSYYVYCVYSDGKGSAQKGYLKYRKELPKDKKSILNIFKKTKIGRLDEYFDLLPESEVAKASEFTRDVADDLIQALHKMYKGEVEALKVLTSKFIPKSKDNLTPKEQVVVEFLKWEVGLSDIEGLLPILSNIESIIVQLGFNDNNPFVQFLVKWHEINGNDRFDIIDKNGIIALNNMFAKGVITQNDLRGVGIGGESFPIFNPSLYELPSVADITFVTKAFIWLSSDLNLKSTKIGSRLKNKDLNIVRDNILYKDVDKKIFNNANEVKNKINQLDDLAYISNFGVDETRLNKDSYSKKDDDLSKYSKGNKAKNTSNSRVSNLSNINNQTDLKTLEKLRILYNNTKGFTDINVEQQQELKDLLSTNNN